MSITMVGDLARGGAVYADQHPDGTWWVHYRDDDGTAAPEPMEQTGQFSWSWHVGGDRWNGGIGVTTETLVRRKRKG